MTKDDCKLVDTKMIEHRRKHFAVEVVPARHPSDTGEVTLSVTHNGNQWTSISLLPNEVEAVLMALKP